MRRRQRAERRRAVRRASIAAGAALGAGAIFAPGAQAANLEVDVLTDGAADGCDPGACTLRDAVAASNANGEADNITFAPGLSGAITLTAGTAPGQLRRTRSRSPTPGRATS